MPNNRNHSTGTALGNVEPPSRDAARRYIARLKTGNGYVNLCGNYNYLEHGYYASQELEMSGERVAPTCKQMLDAYITPLMLQKARESGIRVPDHYITNGYFEPPAIVDTINPFMYRHSLVLKQGHVDRVARSLTRNFKYAICCQEIPVDAKVGFFRQVLGSTQVAKYRDVAQAIWSRLHIPLAEARIVTLASGEILLSDLSPLPYHKLNARERQQIEEQVDEWLT